MVLPKLGIDQSKKYFDSCLLCNGKETKRRFSNDIAGFRALSEWLVLKGAPRVHLCVEATGRYANDLVTYMHQTGHQVSVVNPARIVAHRKAKGWRNKTDKLDSMVIADYAASNELRLWQPPTADMSELRDIVGQMALLKKHRTAYANRAQCGLMSDDVLEMNRRLSAVLEQELKLLESKAESIIARDSKLARIRAILLTVPGIGAVNALALTALIDFSLFRTGRDLAVFLGLATNLSHSGTSDKRSRSSKEGNSSLRALLKMGALSAQRGFYRGFARRLQHGKEKGKVTVAVARKMILIAHACVRNDTVFNPNYMHPLSKPV